MVKIESKAGLVELCWSCALASMPGTDSTWLEARHAEFRDHLLGRIQAAAEKEGPQFRVGRNKTYDSGYRKAGG